MTFSVSRRIAASTEDVWALLTDTSRWPDWGPSITGVEPAAARPGPAPGPHPEGLRPAAAARSAPSWARRCQYTVTAFEPGRYWSWSVAGIPATGHRVIPHGGGCLVTFTVPWWAPAYLPVCTLALHRIERLATR